MIEFKNVSFAYEEGAKNVLSDIDLEIKKGECVAVLGHNGCGKSTLAKLMNGILIPTAGDVFVNGLSTRDEERLFDIRRAAGMVFQNSDNQIVSSIVEEDVAFACENLGMESAEIRKRVDEALSAVDMLEYRTHAPHLLSGGQKQRVAIAGVLAMEPQALILDEPTAMLDPRGRREVLDTVLGLNREKGMTVVLITHHMDEAALCSRVVVMHEGRIALTGTPKEVFSQVEKMRELSLDVPQTVKLLYELDSSLDLTALSVKECADQIEKYLRG
ncbi:MAG: energy-coupling factor transporter ATPase [Clostridia bacterium]|nr:energy-coupling factor transporter ATPase [Clostridia bacterium]